MATQARPEEHQEQQGRHLELTMNPETFQLLQELAASSGKPIGEVLADAIGLERTITRARRAGYRILLEQGGKYDELISP